MTTTDRSKSLWKMTVLPVWVAAAIAAVIVGVTSPEGEHFTWLTVSLGAAVVATFALQLSTLTKVGFVDRMMASVGGVVVILAIATGVFALLSMMSG